VDDVLDELLPQLPAIAIEGPKAVGKTRTGAERARTVRRLDDRNEVELIEADPGRLLTGEPPILIDEWQRYPSSYDVVRHAVDDDLTPGRFILTGSAAPREPVHSGAGRIPILRMRPLSFAERALQQPTVSVRALLTGTTPKPEGDTAVGLGTYVEEILRSGFPALRELTGRAHRVQLEGYVDRIVDKDFAEIGAEVRQPGTLRRWMAAYAAATATTTSWEKVRDAASAGAEVKPARSTTIPYREVLERLFVLDELPAWAPTHNRLGRLAQAPKHHLADPALATALLGMGKTALLAAEEPLASVPRHGTFLGALFESLALLSLRVYAEAAEARVSHMRLEGGRHEIDIVVERADGRVVAFETKLARSPSNDDVKHLLWLRSMLGDDLLDAVIVTTGPHAYRRKDGVLVAPLALLGP